LGFFLTVGSVRILPIRHRVPRPGLTVRTQPTFRRTLQIRFKQIQGDFHEWPHFPFNGRAPSILRCRPKRRVPAIRQSRFRCIVRWLSIGDAFAGRGRSRLESRGTVMHDRSDVSSSQRRPRRVARSTASAGSSSAIRARWYLGIHSCAVSPAGGVSTDRGGRRSRTKSPAARAH